MGAHKSAEPRGAACNREKDLLPKQLWKYCVSSERAAMKFQALFFLLLFTCMCLSLAQGSYGNCCLGHIPRMRKSAWKNIENYSIQETDGDCNIRAVVFLMKRKPRQPEQQKVCVNPEEPWVQRLIELWEREQARIAAMNKV